MRHAHIKTQNIAAFSLERSPFHPILPAYVVGGARRRCITVMDTG